MHTNIFIEHRSPRIASPRIDSTSHVEKCLLCLETEPGEHIAGELFSPSRSRGEYRDFFSKFPL